MNNPDPEISFIIQYNGEDYSIGTHTHAYRNLMVLIKDRIYPDSFGECGGMGRCGTCCVNISGLKEGSSKMERNESVTIKRTGMTEGDTRLSCQILIDKQLKGCIIKITDQ